MNSCLSSNERKVLDISTVDFSNKINTNTGIILDVRTIDEINNGHIENASFIDFYDENFKEKATWINKDLPVYVYCHAGGYSHWIEKGYKVVNQGKELSFASKTYSNDEIENVINQNERVLLVFKTPWCLPCKKLKPVLDTLLIQYPDLNFIDINMDVNKSLASHFSVLSVPTMFYYHDKSLEFTHTGFIELKDLLTQLKMSN